MKGLSELSVEEKAKRFDEAIEMYKARQEYECQKVREFMEYLFPELKESDGEKIRKWIINYLNNRILNSPITDEKKACSDAIAWLEKQGKIVDYYEDRLDECACKYFNKGYKQALEKQGEQKSATIDIDKMVDNYANNKERGNEEFGKPVNCMIKAYRQGLIDAIGKVVLKPAWSEEDETMIKVFDSIIRYIVEVVDKDALERFGTNREELFSSLKSLKDRTLQQPKQEWSEEDGKILNSLISSLARIGASTRTDSTSINYTFSKEIDWLKSLRPQSQWKPSDEQIYAFEKVYDWYNNNFAPSETLTSLYNDLKKLRGE